MKQKTLFQQIKPVQIDPALNGFYYEKTTKLFVSFVLGERYYENPEEGDEKWRTKIKETRSI